MPLLQVQNCSIHFGGIQALRNLSFALEAGELLGIIGPNGAGKTTLFNLLTGVYGPSSGELKLDGRSLKGLKTHQISRLGLARTFQNIRLFPNLSVLDHLRVACQTKLHYSSLESLLASPRFRAEEAQTLSQSEQLLEQFGLLPFKDELAQNLCYGDQRRLEIARALATAPKILLLDEPAAGMNATEKQGLLQLIRRLQAERQLSLILIEHDMKMVMQLCPRIIVLDYGDKIAEGNPEAIRKNPQVIEAYLGKE